MNILHIAAAAALALGFAGCGGGTDSGGGQPSGTITYGDGTTEYIDGYLPNEDQGAQQAERFYLPDYMYPKSGLDFEVHISTYYSRDQYTSRKYFTGPVLVGASYTSYASTDLVFVTDEYGGEHAQWQTGSFFTTKKYDESAEDVLLIDNTEIGRLLHEGKIYDDYSFPPYAAVGDEVVKNTYQNHDGTYDTTSCVMDKAENLSASNVPDDGIVFNCEMLRYSSRAAHDNGEDAVYGVKAEYDFAKGYGIVGAAASEAVQDASGNWSFTNTFITMTLQ